MKFFAKLLIILITFGLLPAGIAFAVSDTTNINLEVTSPCNNNGKCEIAIGENISNCATDCSGPGPASTGGNSYAGVFIKDILVENIGFDSAKVSWNTAGPAFCSFLLGVTPSFEKEVVLETALTIAHYKKLENLQISTAYYYKITCEDGNGLQDNSGDKNFKTLSVLGNPSSFTAEKGDKEIILTWKNPTDANFKAVRLVRNSYFYPANFKDGVTIYDGVGENFTDKNLINGKSYYYTIFAYDKENNYSSGAIIFGAPKAKEEVAITSVAPKTPVVPEIPKEPVITTLPKALEKITINDFNFYSNGQKISAEQGQEIVVQAGKPLTLSIDYDKVPDFYKNIAVNLDINSNRYSYLFDVNNEKTIFTSGIKVPDVTGTYPLQILFFNDAHELVKKIEVQLRIYKSMEIFPGVSVSTLLVGRIVLVILFILVITFIFIWTPALKF